MIAVAMAAVLLTAWTFLAPAWAQFSGAPTKQKVSISQTTTDNDVDAIQSGTWTVQPGNTQNTVPWLAKLHDGTNALAAYLDLDTGAGTAFRQGVGLRISGAGGSIEAKGQQVMASSVPVALGADQSALSVTRAANQSVKVAQVNGGTTTTGNGISGTGVQRVSIASDSTGQVALAAGVATIGSLVANQSVNTAQINGVAPTMGNGISGTGVQRVTLASDSTGQVALAAGAATIGSLAANQSVNTSQINGVAPSMGNGVDGTGVQRVTLASDSTGQVVLAAGAAIIGSLAANQSVNMAQAAGAALLVGNGITGTGSPRVTIASDNTPFTVNAAQSGTWNVGTLTTITNAVTTQDQAQAERAARGTARTRGLRSLARHQSVGGPPARADGVQLEDLGAVYPGLQQHDRSGRRHGADLHVHGTGVEQLLARPRRNGRLLQHGDRGVQFQHRRHQDNRIR